MKTPLTLEHLKPLIDAIDRLERKVDGLLQAIADEIAGEEEAPAKTLDGDAAGAARDTSAPL